MSKPEKNNYLTKILVISFVLGILLTASTYFYSRTSTGEFCSSDYTQNATIDCSLVVNSHGFPLAYYIEPAFVASHGLQPVQLIGDVLVWSFVVASAGLIFRKIKK